MDAHEREAAGAAAGMAEIYGTPAHAREGLDDCYGRHVTVGQWITWAEAGWPAGRTLSGLVEAIDAGRYVVTVDGTTHYVATGTVFPF